MCGALFDPRAAHPGGPRRLTGRPPDPPPPRPPKVFASGWGPGFERAAPLVVFSFVSLTGPIEGAQEKCPVCGGGRRQHVPQNCN